VAIVDDFAIDGAGAITHVSGATNYTVLQLHRWLQDLADDAQATVGDLIDITTSTPSERSTDNIVTLNSPFNINAAAAEYLYDGSITQKGGDEIFAGLVVVGAVETGTNLQIWQDEAIVTSHWAAGKNADAPSSILNRVLVKVRTNGADIDGRKIIVWARELGHTYAEFSVTMGLGNNVAAIFTSPDLNNVDSAITIAAWSDITNTEGYQLIDINADGTPEAYYSRWDFGAKTAKQVYQRTKWIQRRGSTEAIHSTTGPLFRGITHQFDYDAETTTPPEDAVIAWGTSFAYISGTGTVPTAGSYWKNDTVGGVGKVVYVSPGAGATGTVVIQRETTTQNWVTTNIYSLLGGTGSITQSGAVAGPTNAGGCGRLLAKVDAGTTGTLWIQLMSGAPPADPYELWGRGTVGKLANTNSAAATKTVSPEFIGTYTGSSIIGAFGIGIDPGDGISADLFTTLLGAPASPPNNQMFKVFGLAIGDRVLVAENSGGAPNFDQFTLDGNLATGAITAILMHEDIPADTPALTGANGPFLRIKLDTGVYRQIAYNSWAGKTFQITSTSFTDPLDATDGNFAFIAYIDIATSTTEEAVTLKYSGDRTMFVRVRDGGGTPIKTFESTAGFIAGGGSATAIRTSDA